MLNNGPEPCGLNAAGVSGCTSSTHTLGEDWTSGPSGTQILKVPSLLSFREVLQDTPQGGQGSRPPAFSGQVSG